MAITFRKGLKQQFDKNKLIPGEPAVVTDNGGELWCCFSSGNVKQMATKEDLQNMLNTSTEAAEALTELLNTLEDETVAEGILADITELQTDKLDTDGGASNECVVAFETAATDTDIASGDTHSTLFGKIKKRFSSIATKLNNVISDSTDGYNSESPYAVGDYCIKDNVMYKCTTAITTAEAWNAAHWTATNCKTEIKALNDNLSGHSIKTGTLTITANSTSTFTTLTIAIPQNATDSTLVINRIIKGITNELAWNKSFDIVANKSSNQYAIGAIVPDASMISGTTKMVLEYVMYYKQ